MNPIMFPCFACRRAPPKAANCVHCFSRPVIEVRLAHCTCTPLCLQEASAKGRKALLAAIARDEGSSSEEEDSDEELDEVEDSTQDDHGVDCCHSEVEYVCDCC